METISAPHPEWLEIQHAGPSSMAYTAGSPIIRATIHGQRGCLLSLIPRFYPDEGRRRKSSRIGHDGIVLWKHLSFPTLNDLMLLRVRGDVGQP
jgi:hypothetical protein